MTRVGVVSCSEEAILVLSSTSSVIGADSKYRAVLKPQTVSRCCDVYFQRTTMAAARRVLVTGAGSGIGKGIAQFLSCSTPKHAVIVTDLQLHTAEAAAEEIRSLGGNVIGAYGLDVSNRESIKALMANLASSPPDVLVNNVSFCYLTRRF